MFSVRGATLVELVITLAIVGVCLAVAAVAWPRPALADEARAVARTVDASRMHAIVAGQPTAVTSGPCAGDTSFGGATSTNVLHSWPPRGLLFTPDGLPRTCDGGGVGNTTILLEHRGRHAAVIVSSLGRVRWELR